MSATRLRIAANAREDLRQLRFHIQDATPESIPEGLAHRLLRNTEPSSNTLDGFQFPVQIESLPLRPRPSGLDPTEQRVDGVKDSVHAVIASSDDNLQPLFLGNLERGTRIEEDRSIHLRHSPDQSRRDGPDANADRYFSRMKDFMNTRNRRRELIYIIEHALDFITKRYHERRDSR